MLTCLSRNTSVGQDRSDGVLGEVALPEGSVTSVPKIRILEFANSPLPFQLMIPRTDFVFWTTLPQSAARLSRVPLKELCSARPSGTRNQPIDRTALFGVRDGWIHNALSRRRLLRS
jgi:hypothetical protein